MRPLVVYHDACADGFAAAFAAWLKLGDEAEYLPMVYGDENHRGAVLLKVAERDVYILDFSLPKEVTEQVFVLASKVIWLDHHKTAFEMWCPENTDFTLVHDCQPRGIAPGSELLAEVILDNNRSGAMIAWEYFHPDLPVPILLKYIDDYDRWQFKLKGTKEVNKALWGYAPWSFEQWKGFLVDGTAHFSTQGAAILRTHDRNVQDVLKYAVRKCTLKDTGYYDYDDDNFIWEGLAANCSTCFTSDVGHELADQSGTFGLLWVLDKDGKVRCSLRSNGDYDVSAIAKTFGGGGHKNAAGFETDIGTLARWLGMK